MKRSKRIISLILAVVMLVLAIPVTSFAARGETYIKEIRISTGATAAEAKKFLTDNGYTVVDEDLNQRSGKDCVYMGYKKTTNPDEAITDIALMQMDGGYSFSEYEALLEAKMNEISEMLDSIDVCLTEARANLAAGKSNAQGAREVLNFFKEDDSGMLLGDFLLGQETSRADLVKVFLQSNADVSTIIYNMLAFACTDNDENTNWLAKLKSVDIWEDYDPLLYSDAAYATFESFKNIHDMMVTYTTEYIAFAEEFTNDPEYADYTDEEIQDLMPDSFTEYMVIYEALSKYTYGGKPLLDFFMKDPNEIDTDELYPLVSALSVGQQQIVRFVSLTSLISFAESNEETAEEFVEAIKGSFALFGTSEAVSVYYGVDRSLFEAGGVALTSASLRKAASTGDNSWFSGDNIDPVLNTCLHAVAGSFTALAIGAALYGRAANNAAKGIYEVTLKSQIADQMFKLRWLDFDLEVKARAKLGPGSNLTFEEALKQVRIEKAEYIAELKNPNYGKAVAKEASAKMAKLGLTVNVIAGVAMGISLIVEGINIGIRVYNYYNDREYSEIPRAMVDEVLTSTDSYYVNYYAAKDQNDKPADLNAWSAQRWQALYTTTDKKAGDPIIASSLTVKLKDSSFPSDEHGAVHYFGETAAANVNRYHIRATASQIFIFYKRDHSLSMTASTFTGGQLVMFTGFGLIGGVALGSIGVIGAGKLKNKKKDETES